MSQIRQWLETIGLAQYVDAFEANDVDMELVKNIDDPALRELGMSSTGHRVRIRNAIARRSSVVLHDGLSFEVRVPKAETRNAIEEFEAGGGSGDERSRPMLPS
jgi:hypothetical protein